MAAGCAKAQAADVMTYFPFVVCLEGDYTDPTEAKVLACAAKQPGLNGTDINACTKDGRGAKILRDAGAKTPPHKGVPFMTMNGAHFVPEGPWGWNILNAVCDYWKGARPAGCQI
eukprot:TRINITY_DN3236_c0_g1_i1.p3 TRINITY_DN3236_c0_g1~~TRINITY_DN3236_c0_g1_i1.p3  ORF type:complete len:115 (+),score=52.78 TRINITY_DN3236_c0_g1_i1:317-661(+)